MSISEARRQLRLAEDLATTPDKAIFVYLGNAVVEALAESRPYDGDLNSVRIPVQTLRQLTVELVQLGQEDIGAESLIRTLVARIKGSDVDS